MKGTRLSPIILCPVAMKETRGFTGFYKAERFFCENLKQVSLSRTKISVNNRIRFLIKQG